MSFTALGSADGTCERNENNHISVLSLDHKTDRLQSVSLGPVPAVQDSREALAFMGKNGQTSLDQSHEARSSRSKNDGLSIQHDDNQNKSPPEQKVASTIRSSVYLRNTLKQRVDQLDHFQDLILLKQCDADHKQQALDHCLKFLLESITAVFEGVENVTTKADLDAWYHKFRNRESQFQKDYHAFVDQNGLVAESRAEISKDQSRLKRRTARLSQHLALPDVRIDIQRSQAAIPLLRELESNSTSEHSSARPSTPPLLAEYYSRKGDVGIYKERLQELEEIFEDELDRRLIMQERGDILDVSEKQFYEEFSAKRADIMSDLSQAELDAQTLAERCQIEGFPIEEQSRESSEGSTPLTDRVPQGNLPLPPTHMHDACPPSPPATATSSQRHVQKWLDNLNVVDQASRDRQTARGAPNYIHQPTITPSLNPLRRSVSFPQYSGFKHQSARLSISRSYRPRAFDRQQEGSEFEFVDWTERDAKSLPEGEKAGHLRWARARLTALFHWPFGSGR